MTNPNDASLEHLQHERRVPFISMCRRCKSICCCSFTFARNVHTRLHKYTHTALPGTRRMMVQSCASTAQRCGSWGGTAADSSSGAARQQPSSWWGYPSTPRWAAGSTLCSKSQAACRPFDRVTTTSLVSTARLVSTRARGRGATR
jgi:hypothetical protein